MSDYSDGYRAGYTRAAALHTQQIQQAGASLARIRTAFEMLRQQIDQAGGNPPAPLLTFLAVVDEATQTPSRPSANRCPRRSPRPARRDAGGPDGPTDPLNPNGGSVTTTML